MQNVPEMKFILHKTRPCLKTCGMDMNAERKKKCEKSKRKVKNERKKIRILFKFKLKLRYKEWHKNFKHERIVHPK